MNWQPIETAPKRIAVLCYWQGMDMPYDVATKMIAGDWVLSDDEGVKTPTHWMPLPEPPQ